MMTKVIPRAMEPTIEVFLKMLRRFPGVMNRGAATPQIAIIGSSRRITIMQAGRDARSSNIRVINRRQEPLRPLLEMPHLLKRRE
jgi:hypothetical protein